MSESRKKLMEQIEGWHGMVSEEMVEKMQELNNPQAFIAFLGAFSDMWCDMHGYDSDEIREAAVRIGKIVKEMKEGNEMPTAIWIIPGKEGGEENDL